MAEHAITITREGSAILKQVNQLMAQAEAKFDCARAIFDVLKVEVPGALTNHNPSLPSTLVLIPDSVGEEKGAEKETVGFVCRRFGE